MRNKLVVGNWKMNLTRSEATALAEALKQAMEPAGSVEVALCPAYLSIESTACAVRNTSIQIGAQDVFWAASGAFTGSVSAGMLKDLGCQFCIVGHSETRGRFGKLEVPQTTLGYFSETDETVNLKIKALLFQSIHPILCVGETLSERTAGKTDEVIRTQLAGAFDGIDGAEFLTGVVAYEPVWAIWNRSDLRQCRGKPGLRRHPECAGRDSRRPGCPGGPGPLRGKCEVFELSGAVRQARHRRRLGWRGEPRR